MKHQLSINHEMLLQLAGFVIGCFIAFTIMLFVLMVVVPYPDPDFWRHFAVFGWIIIYVSTGIFTAKKISTAYGTVEIDETSETTMSDEISEE